MNKNIFTFLTCDSNYKDAKIVIFGAPFDSTASNRCGSRFAPNAMRLESMGVETYSPYLDRDLVDIKVIDSGDLVMPIGDPKKALDVISKRSATILKDNKIPFMIGGEHLVTLGQFREVVKKYPDVRIIHFDAHTDLRDEYYDCKLSHATVIKKCYDLIGDNKIYQFGIRSGQKAEFEFAKDHNYIEKSSVSTLINKIQELKNYPIYLTIDLDVLDPSIFPGTGTPEAGGITFKELLAAIKLMDGLNIVGLDINELAPNYDISNVSTAVACVVLRELLLII